MLYVAITRGCESNTAYVYQRMVGEADHEHGEREDIHAAGRGRKKKKKPPFLTRRVAAATATPLTCCATSSLLTTNAPAPLTMSVPPPSANIFLSRLARSLTAAPKQLNAGGGII